MLHKINIKTYVKINTKINIKINTKYETKLIKIYIIKYEINGGIKMVEKFNNYLIIQYPKNKFTNIYKRLITKITNEKYMVTTYYKDKKINKYFKSDNVYSREQIEKLIDNYLKEYNIEKTIYYK